MPGKELIPQPQPPIHPHLTLSTTLHHHHQPPHHPTLALLKTQPQYRHHNVQHHPTHSREEVNTITSLVTQSSLYNIPAIFITLHQEGISPHTLPSTTTHYPSSTHNHHPTTMPTTTPPTAKLSVYNVPPIFARKGTHPTNNTIHTTDPHPNPTPDPSPTPKHHPTQKPFHPTTLMCCL